MKQRSPSPPKTTKRQTSRHVFTLKNVSTVKLDIKYGILTKESLNSGLNLLDSATSSQLDITVPPNRTPIAELSHITFVDENKNEHKCTISMINFDSQKQYYCFWCKHPFMDSPIGCPIRHIPNEVVKTYYSEISQETRIIKGTATKNEIIESKNRFSPSVAYIEINQSKQQQETKQESKQETKQEIKQQETKQEGNQEEENQEKLEQKSVEKKKYTYTLTPSMGECFETDGIFCSFNCCKSFIMDNRKNPLYSQSISLLLKLYEHIHGTRSVTIHSAPHWKMLKEFGGNLTISEFRNSFMKLNYNYHGMYRPVKHLFEEKIIL
jgi:hypothetical protein